MNTEYHFPDTEISPPDSQKLNFVLKQMGKDFDKAVPDINYIFCSDDYLLDINRQYLQHDYYTDIITFESAHPDLAADIFISVDRVKENAEKYAKSFDAELLRVMLHGVLHLCGLPDAEPEEKEIMHKNENYYLSLFSL